MKTWGCFSWGQNTNTTFFSVSHLYFCNWLLSTSQNVFSHFSKTHISVSGHADTILLQWATSTSQRTAPLSSWQRSLWHHTAPWKQLQECTEVTHTPLRKCVWVLLAVPTPHSSFLLEDASLWNSSHETQPFFIYFTALSTHITQLSWDTMGSHDKFLQGWDWSQRCLQPGWSSATAPRESCLSPQTPAALLHPWQLFTEFIIKCSLGRTSMSQQTWLNGGFVSQKALIWLARRKVKAKIGT